MHEPEREAEGEPEREAEGEPERDAEREPGLRPLLVTRGRMPLRERLRAPDSYGLLLVLILTTIVAPAAVATAPWGQLVPVTLQGLVVLFALGTSRAGRLTRWLGRVLVPVAIAVGVASALAGGTRVGRVAAGVFGVTLLITAIVAILTRLAHHHAVTGATVAGAVCAYLLIGSLFALVFATLAVAQRTPFFGVGHDATYLDFVYFSLVTLTTVGYGDLTPVSDAARMLAVTEALLGQLYLVTVVALVVGNVGARRTPTGADAEEDQA